MMWRVVGKWEKAGKSRKQLSKSLNKGSLGKQEENHLDILDAELETGFGEQRLK